MGKGSLTTHSYNIEKSLSQLPERNLQVSFLKNIDIQAYANEKNVSFVVKADAKQFFENPKVFLHTDFGLPVINPIISLSANAKNLETIFHFNKKLINIKEFDTQFVIADNNQSFLFAAPIKVETSNVLNYPSALLLLQLL